MKKIIKLTESDLTRLVKRIIKERANSKSLLEQGDMDDDEKTITDTIFKCAEDVEQEGYDDFFDWANIVFSCAEWKLEEIFDEDIVENLRSNYTEIIQGMWQGGDDEFEY
jgi:hypothetical protein